MGHTQFIPTSYLAYAVDFRGDGVRDIWSDDPTDLAGIDRRLIWPATAGSAGNPGVEVQVPRDFNPRLANTQPRCRGMAAAGPATRFAALTCRVRARRPCCSGGGARAGDPDLPQLPRHQAIQQRRCLCDRRGPSGRPTARRARICRRLAARRPPLNRAEREELQRLLARAGHYSGTIDGRVGQGTLAGGAGLAGGKRDAARRLCLVGAARCHAPPALSDQRR